MTFDKASVGDTARYAERTFGLRPAIPWSEPVTVVSVENTYYGDNVTVSDGTVLSSGLYSMAIVRKAPVARLHYFTDNECGGVTGGANGLALSPDEVSCGECIGMMFEQGVLEAARD